MDTPIIDITDLVGFLEALKNGPVAAYVVGVCWSYFAENLDGWHKLPGQVKFWLGLALSGALPLLAMILLTQNQIVWDADTVWQLALSGIVAWWASQRKHQEMVQTGYKQPE